jgi:hypothetical protein
MIDSGISSVVRTVVAMLVAGDYMALEKLTSGKRLTAAEIERAVKDYGAKLIMSPGDAFENLDIVEIENTRPRKWSVRFDLWAAGEGQSDLSLELTLTESKTHRHDVEINGIHVL